MFIQVVPIYVEIPQIQERIVEKPVEEMVEEIIEVPEIILEEEVIERTIVKEEIVPI